MGIFSILLTVFCCVVTVSWSQEKSFLFVFLNTNPNKLELPQEQVDSIMAGHLANIERLAKEGKLLVAGPFYGGGGIFVLSTASKDTAWEWLKTDPGVRANRWILELLPYTPRKGSICAVGENYEMTTYQFVRYTKNKNMTDKESSSAWEEHERYLRTFSPVDSVVAEGVLGDGESAIFLYKGTAQEEFIKSDPSVHSGALHATMRKIYIAKGSFCED